MLLKALEKNIRAGCLNLRMPDGTWHRFGSEPPEAYWYVNDPTMLTRLLRDPEYALGDTYLARGWDTEYGEGLRTLLQVLVRNFGQVQARGWSRLRELLYRWLMPRNGIARSQRQIEQHYDLDEWLFRRFLDREMFYSCAYFTRPDLSLEEAQQAKCELIRRKLLLQPGQKVLDIGSGWGGLAFYLATRAEVQVTGLTLSGEQWRVARQEAEKRGLAGRVQFLLEDYRQHRGRYDRIVSVGMFEHVGLRNYGAFFRQVEQLLAPDGVALLHTIGCSQTDGAINPWMRRHVFPGAHLPSLSQLAPAVERARLQVADLEVWRLHYAYTLREWFRRFQQVREEVVKRMGERFARLWEFYLAGCEAKFLYGDLVVFQVQMAKQHGPVPITRDYLGSASTLVP
ncbi:cyclopropane-fatty-acyl-phospholipid synthase family protein [Candidatus Methylocalor cossyra]|uniref:Cyclopropane-fatty-acyl-phospholipid synthase n=1 Tax=Candidatus Methylocalor cossyra TaxID=3108543 RepID=A0ABM9NHJ3_9GAMM